MRVLFLAPFVNARNAGPLADVAHSMLGLGHEVQVLARQVTRVQTDGGPVLSHNEASVSQLRQKVGADRVALLHSHTSRTRHQGESRLDDVDTQRVRAWMDDFCPDLVVLGGTELVADDPVIHAFKAVPAAPPALFLSQPSDRGWALADSAGKVVTALAKDPGVLRKSLRTALPALSDRPRSAKRLSSVLAREHERLRSLLKVAAPVAPAPSAKASEQAPSAASEVVLGELESLKDGDVVFGKTLWVKGWIDASPGSAVRSIEVLINERAHWLQPDAVRGDVAQRLNNPDILGFDTRLPLHADGPRLNVVLTLFHKDGRQQVWQRRSLWANDCIPERHQLPVVLGHASIETDTRQNADASTTAAWLQGAVQVREHTLHRLLAFQRGKPLAELDVPAQAEGVEARFRHALPAHTYEASLPLDLWIDLGEQMLIHWQRCPAQAVRADTARSWTLGGAQDGDVIRGDRFQCVLGPIGEGTQPVAFVNGRQATVECGPADKEAHLALSISVAESGNDVQIRLECGSAHQTLQLWRHVETFTASHPGAVTVPRSSTLAPPVPGELARPPSVLLIRKAPSPTDELYITAPLMPLHDRGDIRLEVVDLDDESDKPLAVDHLLAPGTAVVISRYISDRWIAAITRHKARLGPVFYLMDDDVPAALDSRHLPMNYRQRMGKVACGEFQTLIRLCDQFIVTSSHLHARYASDKTVLVEPSYLHPPAHLKHFDDPSEIVITYQGTEGHREDLAAIAPALRAMHDEFKRVRLQIIIGHPRAVPEVLSNLPRCEVIKPMPWGEYKAFRATARAHIAIAPLLDTPYNRGKSIVKLFDIGALGAVGVYSRSATYSGAIEHGVNGLLLDNDPLIWRKALKWLIQRPDEMHRLAVAGQALASRRGDITLLQNFWSNKLGMSSHA